MFAKELTNTGEGVLGMTALMPIFTIGRLLSITESLDPPLVFFSIVIFFSTISLILGGFGLAARHLTTFSSMGTNKMMAGH